MRAGRAQANKALQTTIEFLRAGVSSGEARHYEFRHHGNLPIAYTADGAASAREPFHFGRIRGKYRATILLVIPPG